MNFFKRSPQKSDVVFQSPLNGRFLPLSEVPDETFSQKILGDGFAVDPSDGLVVSPVDGEVIQLFRTKHALGIKSAEGLEILIHVGVDTVKLNGEGFTALVAVGQKVKAGDKLLQFDLAIIKAKAKSAITPVVITNMELIEKLEIIPADFVKCGQDVLRVEKKS